MAPVDSAGILDTFAAMTNRTSGAPVVTAAPMVDAVPRTIWVGLVAAAFYVVMAAGGGLLLDRILGADPDPVVELALTHLVPLPLAIGAGLVFAWRSGWWRDVWTDPPTYRSLPRRW